jgi:ABC-type Co2+ transport system permease subunit
MAPNPAGGMTRRTVLLAVAAAAAIAVHLGLGALLFANSGWATGAADIVLAIVAGKVLLIAVGRVAIRRRRARDH